MGALTKLPNTATPADRILSRFNRDQLAGFIEVAISLLDAAETPSDPDAPDFAPRSDAMPGDPMDAEPTGDDQGDVSWTEWHTRGRRKSTKQGSSTSEPMMRADGAGIAQEDDEDDDPIEENGDEQDCSHAEDDFCGHNLAFPGPGCPVSDGGCSTDSGAGDPCWAEWHTRGRYKIGRHGEEVCRRMDGNMARDDDEDDISDTGIEDDPRGCDPEEDFGGEERGELTSRETIHQGIGTTPRDDDDPWIVPVTLNEPTAENDR